ncbi:hypothetical protein NLX83_21975 [Allokutzneria sp. A3M-2-11 16]|uniref:hypothetical protein n=1 Tax=Allokutzneria sp. A3M-2-11 16 TaxID=2962043 RepID=UPI0020B6E23F|nr:hypothetical protein [Allokutzneria sp. A3M-2-11 16]MCP3801940.1 hypothetical protein [Allokutzneria sp. A3M-2-11 16]
MKPIPRADYSVDVRPQRWEVAPCVAHLYEGVWEVTLNTMVTVAFVADLGQPVDYQAQIPGNLDALTTEKQARMVTAVLADYVVTPNAELAGRTVRTTRPPVLDCDGDGVVFYVDPVHYALMAADLDAFDLVDATISELRGRPAVDFVERVVVTSPEFDHRDAYWLRNRS